jgi:methyltransferase (TIGR00027 family)
VTPDSRRMNSSSTPRARLCHARADLLSQFLHELDRSCPGHALARRDRDRGDGNLSALDEEWRPRISVELPTEDPGQRVLLSTTMTLARLLVLLILGCSQFAVAVEPGQPSWSASIVCAFRAAAALHPDPRLRNPDDLAHEFCELPFELRTHEAAREAIDRDPQTYAGYFYVNARTHHIDDALRRSVLGGATQVVVLGAGYDSRAYRYAKAHPQLKFFEVDLPATQAAKREKVHRIVGSVPSYVTFVPIDFNVQSLEDVLIPAGFDTRAKSLFILEGVSMYIEPAGTAASLDFVARNAASGSQIVFDYLLRDAIETRGALLYGMTSSFRALAEHGEPLITGWTRSEAAAMVRSAGLVVEEDLSAEDLSHLYLRDAQGRPDGRILEGPRILEAKVP